MVQLLELYMKKMSIVIDSYKIIIGIGAYNLNGTRETLSHYFFVFSYSWTSLSFSSLVSCIGIAEKPWGTTGWANIGIPTKGYLRGVACANGKQVMPGCGGSRGGWGDLTRRFLDWGFSDESMSFERRSFLFGISILASSSRCRRDSKANASAEVDWTRNGAKNLSPWAGKGGLAGSRLGLGGREWDVALTSWGRNGERANGREEPTLDGGQRRKPPSESLSDRKGLWVGEGGALLHNRKHTWKKH